MAGVGWPLFLTLSIVGSMVRSNVLVWSRQSLVDHWKSTFPMYVAWTIVRWKSVSEVNEVIFG